MKTLSRLISRFTGRISPEEAKVLAVAQTIEDAQNTAFYKWLMNFAQDESDFHLLNSKGSDWEAGAAAGIKTLTKKIEGFKLQADEIRSLLNQEATEAAERHESSSENESSVPETRGIPHLM